MALSIRWHEALETAGPIIEKLPAEQVGRAVITAEGRLFGGGVSDLDRALGGGAVKFHKGRIGGAWPQVKA